MSAEREIRHGDGEAAIAIAPASRELTLLALTCSHSEIEKRASDALSPHSYRDGFREVSNRKGKLWGETP